jgi:hypothetical protein
VGAVPKQFYQPSGGLDADATLSDLQAFEAALRGPRQADAGEADAIGQTDQLARDIAEIERATAALRKAEPALETWTGPRSGDTPAITPHKPAPVWLLIGLLWLSTALITVGAVAAIARLAG